MMPKPSPVSLDDFILETMRTTPAQHCRDHLEDLFSRLHLPDSLLKIGYTHYELKQWELARSALTQVQEQYPGTTVARLAENRLRAMRVEGHF